MPDAPKVDHVLRVPGGEARGDAHREIRAGEAPKPKDQAGFLDHVGAEFQKGTITG